VKLHLRATGCHFTYGITECYLPPDTSEHTIPLTPATGWYSIYLLWKDRRLSWRRWLVTYRVTLTHCLRTSNTQLQWWRSCGSWPPHFLPLWGSKCAQTPTF